MTNETAPTANFDQFETIIESVQTNMTDWWAAMLIGRVWNSAQMSVGSAGDKKALLDIEKSTIEQAQHAEIERSTKDMSNDRAIKAFTDRVLKKNVKRLESLSEDVAFYDGKIEAAQNVMAVLNYLNPKMVQHFLSEPEYQAESVSSYLMGSTLTDENDIRIAIARTKQPTLSPAKALDIYFSQDEAKLDEAEELVTLTLQNVTKRELRIKDAVTEAQTFSQHHDGMPYEIDRQFLTTHIQRTDASIAKRMAKVQAGIEQGQFKLLSLGMPTDQINQARGIFKETGKYQ